MNAPVTPGVLHLIPNTLGEMPAQQVLTPGVLSLVARLDYFIGENAKTTRAFLKNVGQTCPLQRPIQEIEIRELHVNTPENALPDLLAPLLQGRDAGLVSEAGCPAIADPGANLVRLAHQHDIIVHPLVGPSSLLLALMASGLNGQSFAFQGYLPTDAAARAKRIGELEGRSRQERQTQIFIETPYRNHALFEALLRHCAPETRICVACDLTLPAQFVQTRSARHWRGTLPDIQKRPTVFLLLA